MGKILAPKPPKPDTSALQRQEKLIADQEARLKAQEEAQKKTEEERKKKEEASKRSKKGVSAGGTSLLTGLETGVEPVDPTKRTQLG